jgi:L-ascorbate metabolism protein UlaG (beta-lactamase superfamily)
MQADRVTYIGHATTLIEVGGTRVLTDPVLRPRVGHIRRIAAPVTQDLEADAILLSHAHHDHLDFPSLALVPADTPAIAPPDLARLVRRRTRHDVIELAPGDRVRIGAVEIVATPALHDDRRLPWTPPLGAVGFLVMGSSRLYFAGDTDVFDGMSELSEDLDAALLPVWGWGPRVGPGHLDPRRAAQAAALLRPRVAVPIHWGTLAGPRVWWRADPELPVREFEQFLAHYAPGVTARIVPPGDSLLLDETN